MKTIIKHGNIPYRYRTQCSNCNCVFEYESVDVYSSNYNGWRALVSKWVTCPECEEELSHKEFNAITDENTTD